MHHIHRNLAPRLGGRQRTLTIRNREGLIAVLPFVQQTSGGVGIMQPADFGVCDYNAPVGDMEALAEACADPAVQAQLNAALAGSDVLMYRKVRPESFDMRALFPRLRSSPAENPAYHCETGTDFYQWRKTTMRPKYSKELERLQRQTEREYGSYEHRLLRDPDEIRAAIAFIRDIRRGRYEESLLDDPRYFDFYAEYAAASAARDEARVYASHIGDEMVAALFGLAGDGGFHAVLIGAETEKYQSRSTGIQLIYRIIEMRMAEGYDSFDMGLGDPGYKSHFRPIRTDLLNHTVARSPAGSAVAMIYHHAKPMKNALRRIAANVR
jgi:CelD/BcsL family acetyltransferase involved in cellulose biosynthesis